MEELKQYKQKRKFIEFTCDFCGKISTKPESEYKRNINLGRHNFCSRSCACKFSNMTGSEKEKPGGNSEENKQHLLEINKIKRNYKKRYHEIDIDEEYLSMLWEKQNHKCPYTGLELIIPNYTNSTSIDMRFRASLDRIDSTKGYVKGNVQFVSTPINFMKSKMTDLETKQYLKMISSHVSSLDINTPILVTTKILGTSS